MTEQDGTDVACVLSLGLQGTYLFYLVIFYISVSLYLGMTLWLLPGGSDSKESACNAGDLGLIPGWGKSPGEGNPIQYSCLENSVDREA